MTSMIRVSAADRQALRLPLAALLANKFNEYRTKASGRRIKGQGLIGAAPDAVAQGFRNLKGQDFAEYNFPQVWVERRQIPAAIDGRIPTSRAVVVDLGCGPGISTHVLCHFADPTWTIFGYDLTDHSIAAAQLRAERDEFRNRDGLAIRPRFICQDIALPLRLPTGEPFPDSSVDFAISGGVVGLYMNPISVAQLAAELARIIRPGGFAALDAGPAVPSRTLRSIMHSAGFQFTHAAKCFWIDPRPKLVFRRDWNHHATSYRYRVPRSSIHPSAGPST